MDRSRIKERMEVVGSDGGHVGIVDKLDGDRIKLAKHDPAAQSEHQYLDLGMVQSVDGDIVRLNRTTAQAQAEWGAKSIGAGI